MYFITSYSLVYDVEIIPVVSLVDDVVLGFDQNLKHGVQNFRELFLIDNKQMILFFSCNFYCQTSSKMVCLS